MESLETKAVNSNANSQLGLTAKLVNFFLDNRQLTLMLLVIILVGGLLSFSRLRVEGFPAVDIPVAIVTTVVPGAGPDTINNTITAPLENSLRELGSLKESSATSQNNISIIALTFEDGVDIDLAVQEARTKIASANLPDGVSEPQILVPDISGAPFIVAVSGATTLVELNRNAKALEEKLLAVSGVKSFTGISGAEEKIYIELPPQYQLPQVIDQIKLANVAFPLGEAVIDGKRIPISGQGQARSLEEIQNLSISLPALGPEVPAKQMRLADFASVYVEADLADRVHRAGFLKTEQNQFKIQPALLYEIRLDKDVDLIAAGKRVQEAVASADQENELVDYAIVFDQSYQSQRQVDEIVAGAIGAKWDTDSSLANLGYLFGGLWLLIIAMLLFLDWRSALISTLAMPLSILFTFISLAAMNIQLNTLVLFSLVLVIGLIVDPAIVVLESMKRYMEVGYRNKAAVLRSVDMIGLGLFIAVLTSVVVFIPFSVVSGTFGEIIKYIPLTVFPALVASYFVPLIFLTWLGEKFLRTTPSEKLSGEDDIHTLWPMARWFIRANRYVLSKTWLSIAVVLLSLAIPVAVTAALFSSGQVRQVQFSQPDDSEYVQISIPKPANQTYSQLKQMTIEVENVLKKQVGQMKTFFYQSIDGSGSNQTLDVFIELLPTEQRDIKSPEIVEQLSDDLKAIFGARTIVSELSAGPPSEQFPVIVKVFDNNSEVLASATAKLAEQLRSYEEIDLVITDNESPSSELVIQVDLAKANELGVSAPAVFGQVASLLGETQLFRSGEYDVVVKISEESKPNTVSALQALTVFGSQGAVKLGDVATIEETLVASSIRRSNGERYAQVSAQVKDVRDAIAVQRRITDWAKSNTELLGVSERAFEDRAGVNEFEKSFQELFMAIAFAILATYVIFVLFFRSFIQPFIILFSIPLILIGVFPALAWFGGGQFGFLEIIGIIMVIGIAENVAIFLIDYANRKVSAGMSKHEAVALASGIRFRAVVLTQITTLVGLLPLAVFSPFWRGLALVVIFGIISSSLLSLFTTPVLYVWFTRKKTAGFPDTEDQSPLPFDSNPNSMYTRSLPPQYPV